MKYHFDCPERKKVRLIVNTDAKNEADDQFAIVHALLSPKFDVKGLIAAQFGERHTTESMQESYDECVKITSLMHSDVKTYKGAKKQIQSKTDYEYSEGAELIVKEALSDDPSPLYVLFLGPLTDMACAYLEHPEIGDKVTVIWIGGGDYPAGGGEFNLSNDIPAANVVMESKMELWQIDRSVYSTMIVSLAELEYKLRSHGKIGNYLFQQMVDFNNSPRAHWTSGETWSLGDSPAVGVILNEQAFSYEMVEAPRFNDDMTYVHNTGYRKIRVYKRVDSRFILEDMFCKIAMSFPNPED
ncbi:nucleoside hydrolase [Massiliimalia massiliensis]|uniref:nucleoside hydrolase n=1 Tax=Massiliimalia massiliensis TaxID=1852384 RepID=UPI0009871CA5|nr:nucleoside hydrolase [Massiliimalia massiliensis]